MGTVVTRGVSSFRADVSVFARQYNRLLVPYEKNARFLVFYRELTEALWQASNLPVRSHDEFLQAMGQTVGTLHEWDGRIDDDGVPIREARMMTFGPERMAELADQFDGVGLCSSGAILMNGLDFVEEYFNIEAECRSVKKTIADGTVSVRDLLCLGNCDFYTYGELQRHYFLRHGGNAVDFQLTDRFLACYFPLDLLLDNLVDLKGDREKGDFNVLLLGVSPQESGYRELCRSGVVGELVELGFEYAERAREALVPLESTPSLHQLLSGYLAGEVEGLEIFRRYGYFVDLSEEDRQWLLDVLLKPNPWECRTKGEVTEWLRANQQLLIS